MMKIYTKTGDQGMTSLVGGKRVSKTDVRLESYGTIDELNSFVGLLLTEVEDAADREFLLRIQSNLFVVGSFLATDQSDTRLREHSRMEEEEVALLETHIDQMLAVLPPQKGFILPSGTKGAALAHVCRTVCRRAERRMLALLQSTTPPASPLDPLPPTSPHDDASHGQQHTREERRPEDIVLSYVNRLSDYFFVFARKMNFMAHFDEINWKKPCR